MMMTMIVEPTLAVFAFARARWKIKQQQLQPTKKHTQSGEYEGKKAEKKLRQKSRENMEQQKLTENSMKRFYEWTKA